MLSAVDDSSSAQRDQLDLRIRKMRFKSDAHIWGVQARMQAGTCIYHLNPGPEQSLDMAFVVGDLDLRRLRQNAPLMVLRWTATRNNPEQPDPVIGPDGSPLPVPGSVTDEQLLPEFCSKPLPEMRPVTRADGSNAPETELIVPPGRTGEVTLYSAQRRHNACQGPQSLYATGKFVSTPMETLCLDLLVPAGLSDPTTARVIIYGRRTHPEQVYDLRPGDRLPQRETVTHLGTLQGVPRVNGAPHHEASVRTTLRAYGWLGAHFDVYRCRIKYPVLHSLVFVGVDPVRP